MVSRTVYDSEGKAWFSVDQYLADGAVLDASLRTIHGTETLFDSRGRLLDELVRSSEGTPSK